MIGSEEEAGVLSAAFCSPLPSVLPTVRRHLRGLPAIPSFARLPVATAGALDVGLYWFFGD
jgi:hypothetical protein